MINHFNVSESFDWKDKGYLEEIRNILRTRDFYLLVTHVRPDGDAVGSLLALKEALKLMGKKVEVFCESPIPHIFGFLEGVQEVKHDISDLSPFPYEVIVFLDCGSLDRGGGKIKNLLNDSKIIINIDHHINENPFGHICWIKSSASSTCEMLYDMLNFMEVPLNRTIVSCLYTGILTDTGSFQFSNTNQKVLKVASDLVASGVSPRFIAESIFESALPSKLILLGLVLATLVYHRDYTIASARLTKAMIERAGAHPDDSDGFVNILRQVGSVKLAVLFREDENGIVHVGLRSKGSVDVAAFARHYGGGGHANASACRISGDMDKVEEMIVESLKTYMDTGVVA